MIAYILGFIWGLAVTGWFMTMDDKFYKHPMFYFIVFFPSFSDFLIAVTK